MKLNLGSGKDYRKGWVNLDTTKEYNVDVLHDLNEYPYPFKDNYFEEIDCLMVLEHVNNPIACLRELVRITKDKGKINILVPHATTYSNFTAFDHKAHFTESSFDELILREAGLSAMKLIGLEFVYYNKWKRYIPFKSYLKIFLNGIYDDMRFEFEVRK